MSFLPALNARSSKTPRCPRESTKLYASLLIYGEQFRTVSYRESNRLHTNERPASLFVVPSELRRTAVRNLVPSYILRCRWRQQVVPQLDGTFASDYTSLCHQTPLFVVYISYGRLFKQLSVSFCLFYASRRSALISFVTCVLSVQTSNIFSDFRGVLIMPSLETRYEFRIEQNWRIHFAKTYTCFCARK